MLANMKEEYNTKIKDLEQVKEVFDKFNVRLILVYGALLGFYRDGNFLPGDDDIDLAVVDKVPFEIRKKIGWLLYDLGFEPQDIMFNVFGRMEMAEPGYNGDGETGIIVCRRNTNFTIFFFGKEEDCKLHGREYVCIPKLGAMKLIATPVRFYKKLGEIKIGKKKYFTPYPIEDYLEFSYKNWRDKTLRDHSPTYSEAHPEYREYIKNISQKNEAIIWKNQKSF